jgi:tetratricopeptide (TPR) repeat protein
LIREARAASALNHPNIVTVYDIGSEAGVDFISMEYVEGQSLAQVIQGKGLPLERALDYAIAIADALVRAHAAGVIHRDLKPGNIMVTGDGQVKLLDFGLARQLNPADGETSTLTGVGVIAGTPHYMSPEQARGSKVDARSDLFSLGAVLFEMIAGRRPFEGDTPSHAMMCVLEKQPAPLASYVPEAPEELQRIVGKALEKDPEQRYQSAKDLEIDLKRLQQKLSEPAPAKAGMSNRHWRSAAALSVMVVALVAGLVIYLRRPPPLSAKDTILLADFVNTTGDAVFDDTLKQGLAAQLEQSLYLVFLSDDRIRETLRHMQLPMDSKITNEIGREICQRAGVKALIEGSVAQLGSHYVITLQAVKSATGEPLVRLQVEAQGKERVLTALSDAATRLRRKLGDSMASIAKSDGPLPGVTTTSLDALKAYTLGVKLHAAYKLRDAIVDYKRAVELDPNFVAAHASLATCYQLTGQVELRDQTTTKAFELRTRVGEWERLQIENHFYEWVSGELDRGIEVGEAMTHVSPLTPASWNLLSVAYMRAGEVQKGVASAREAFRLSPSAIMTSALAGALIMDNQLAEAKEVCVQASTRNVDSPACHGRILTVAFLSGDNPEIKKQFAWASARPDKSTLTGWQVSIASYQGQLRRERELMHGPNFSGLALDEAMVGHCRQSAEDSAKALGLSHLKDVRMNVVAASAYCGDREHFSAAARGLAEQYPKDTALNRAFLPCYRALLDLQSGHAPKVAPDSHANPYGYVWGLPLYFCRGEVALKTRNGAAAAAQFQQVLDRRSWSAYDNDYPMAHLELARAAALIGDLDKSRKFYQEFFNLWKEADADLPIMQEAKREYAKLQGSH